MKLTAKWEGNFARGEHDLDGVDREVQMTVEATLRFLPTKAEGVPEVDWDSCTFRVLRVFIDGREVKWTPDIDKGAEARIWEAVGDAFEAKVRKEREDEVRRAEENRWPLSARNV